MTMSNDLNIGGGRGALIYSSLMRVCPNLRADGQHDVNKDGVIQDNEKLRLNDEGLQSLESYWEFYLANSATLSDLQVEYLDDYYGIVQARFPEMLAREAICELSLMPRDLVPTATKWNYFGAVENTLTRAEIDQTLLTVGDAQDTLIRMGEKALPFLRKRLEELLYDDAGQDKTEFTERELVEVRRICSVLGRMEVNLLTSCYLTAQAARPKADAVDVLMQVPDIDEPMSLLLETLPHSNPDVGTAAMLGVELRNQYHTADQNACQVSNYLANYSYLVGIRVDSHRAGVRIGALLIGRPERMKKLVHLYVNGLEDAGNLLYEMRNLGWMGRKFGMDNLRGVATELALFACQTGDRKKSEAAVSLIGRMAEGDSREARDILRKLATNEVVGERVCRKPNGRYITVPIQSGPLGMARLDAQDECRRIKKETFVDILDVSEPEVVGLAIGSGEEAQLFLAPGAGRIFSNTAIDVVEFPVEVELGSSEGE